MSKPLLAPSPGVGDCQQKTKWSKGVDPEDCKRCFDYEDMFYCDGQCMSKYSSETCSNNSPVAKIPEQCSEPCVQISYPNPFGGCSDRFDCKDWKNEDCVQKSVYDGNTHSNVLKGVCVPSFVPFHHHHHLLSVIIPYLHHHLHLLLLHHLVNLVVEKIQNVKTEKNVRLMEVLGNA